MTEGVSNRPNTVADYLTIVLRRKWMIIAPPVLAGLVAFALSTTQSPVYQATAKVLVKRTSFVSAIANVQDPSSIGDPTRFLTTEASIARSPELARRVVAEAGVPGETVRTFLNESSVKPESAADVLDVSVSNRDPGDAEHLANTYATEFTRYRTELDTSRINETLKTLNIRAEALRALGATGSVAYATVIQNQSQLVTIGKLLADNTSVLQRAEGAAKVRPRPLRTGILGVLLGGVLGLGLGFLAEALDRRVRSEEEVVEALGLPVLGRIPQPPRRLRKTSELMMLADPTSIHAETFRKLRTSIEFVNLEHEARTIMVTSAVQNEGKSTTIANLAVAFARAGRRVALADLDLRRPFLDRFFRVGAGPGITDVAVGRVSLADAIRSIALTPDAGLNRTASANGRRRPDPATASNGGRELEGVLGFLPAGTIPPSGGEFLEDERIKAVIDQLAEQFDVVLIDSPPLLAFGDAMTLSLKVDAMFVVVRLAAMQRPLLHELARQLQNCRATLFGCVLTGVKHGESYQYVYEAYGHDVRPRAEDAQQRQLR
jgi:Mrp family chromosome partitioning ATPase/capsular polysaccharide biosynthesis protein